MSKIVIIGSGAMGTALGKVLFDAGYKNIHIYGIDQKELNNLKQGKNPKYFSSQINLPKFKVESNLNKIAQDAKYIIISIPSFAFTNVFPQLVDAIKNDCLIINSSKGFYPHTELPLHLGMKRIIKGNKYIRGVVSLIGPSHAKEIVLQMPTMVAAVSKKHELSEEVQKLFFNNYFKVYCQKDVIGASNGAIYKNILAIATGMASGLGYGINTIAALLTRGMKELWEFNKIMGGKSKTIMGLTGLGDLIVTATSKLSRNFCFGRDFIKKKLKLNLEKNSKTIEGIFALKIIKKIQINKKLDLPIVNFLYDVIFHQVSPQSYLEKLWERDFTIE